MSFVMALAITGAISLVLGLIGMLTIQGDGVVIAFFAVFYGGGAIAAAFKLGILRLIIEYLFGGGQAKIGRPAYGGYPISRAEEYGQAPIAEPKASPRQGGRLFKYEWMLDGDVFTGEKEFSSAKELRDHVESLGGYLVKILQ
jgi:hypothetical protein